MTNARINPPRNLPRLNADPPTYCQFVRPVTFQEHDLTLSPTAFIVIGVGPSPLASYGAAQATPELTENATAAPKSSTPTALKVGNRIFNLTLPTGLEYQELPADTYSYVTSMGSFGANDNNSTYLKSSKNSPAIENITPDLWAIIEAPETSLIFL